MDLRTALEIVHEVADGAKIYFTRVNESAELIDRDKLRLEAAREQEALNIVHDFIANDDIWE